MDNSWERVTGYDKYGLSNITPDVSRKPIKAYTFAMEPFIEEGLEAIRRDRDRGASELAIQGVRLLASIPGKLFDRDDETILTLTATTAGALTQVRPVMASIGGWAARYYKMARSFVDADECVTCFGPKQADRLLTLLINRRAQVLKNQITEARAVIGAASTIFTLSHSSTTRALIEKAASPVASVIVAESRPLCEGRNVVMSLLEKGGRVTLITDAAIPKGVAKADLVLIGADCITGDGAAINKIGSYTAALAARELGKPLYVAADTMKINPRLSELITPTEIESGCEVWNQYPDICENEIFETVPSKLVTGFLTELGLLTKTGIELVAFDVARLYDTLPHFADND